MTKTNSFSLEEYLNKEFSNLSLRHEAKWVLEELSLLDADLARVKASEIVERRKTGEPLAYILGHWAFRNLNLEVGPGVLIPRPETEELVGHVLKHVMERALQKVKIVDFGSGSGAIAYALADELEIPFEITAVERSQEAFSFLSKNKNTLNLEKQKNIHLIQSDWNSFEGRDFDIIVSNPPYVSAQEYEDLEEEVRSREPKAALVPENMLDPMSAYRELLALSSVILKKDGALFFEFGPAQEPLWAPLMTESQWQVFKDLSGKPRFLYAFDLAKKNS
ncbi:MAG: peptide chain release factor N(5)-glutamine methyltransferase [Bdellovibrionota bacterium]